MSDYENRPAHLAWIALLERMKTAALPVLEKLIAEGKCYHNPYLTMNDALGWPSQNVIWFKELLQGMLFVFDDRCDAWVRSPEDEAYMEERYHAHAVEKNWPNARPLRHTAAVQQPLFQQEEV